MADSQDLPIDYHKCADILRGRQPLVAAGHDESHHALRKDTGRKSVARTQPVTGKGSKCRSRNVEEIGQGRPAKGSPQRRVGTLNDGQPLGGVKAEGVGREIIDEPDQGDNGL